MLDRQLRQQEFIAGEYSVADMAAYPWIVPYERQRQDLDDFPNVKRWFETLRARPAVRQAYENAKGVNTLPTVTEKGKSVLFGQNAAVLAKAYKQTEKSSSGPRRKPTLR